jgi:hypothetical protein
LPLLSSKSLVHTDPPTTSVCHPFPVCKKRNATYLPPWRCITHLPTKRWSPSSKNNPNCTSLYSKNHIKSTYSLYQQDRDSSNDKVGVL